MASDINYNNDKSYTIKVNIAFKEFNSIKQSLKDIIPKIYYKRLAMSTLINMVWLWKAIIIKFKDFIQIIIRPRLQIIEEFDSGRITQDIVINNKNLENIQRVWIVKLKIWILVNILIIIMLELY